jgi:lysophospholipase L1-like esterase
MRRREFITGAAALAAYGQLTTENGLLTSALAAVPSDGDQLPAGFHNFNGSNLANWQAALAAQQRGSSNAIIGCLGDSTVVGHGASNHELRSNAKSLSWPTQLAKLIPNGSWSSVWGDNNVTAAAGDIHDFDNRLNRSGWLVNYIQASGTLCGGFLHGNQAAGSQPFTPTNKIDTIEVWYAQSPGSGNFTIDVDGKSPLATINCDGPDDFLKATVTCPLGFHTVNLRQATRGTHDIYLTALRAFNSGIKEVSVYNLGGCGWGSADFVVGIFPWNTLPAVAAISPNLVIFQAGIINDWNANIPPSSVTANMRTVISALKSINCDVILMSGAPSEPGAYATYATQAAYVENMRSLAYAANVPFIDVRGLWGGAWKRSAMADSLHPNGAGYELIAGYARTAVLRPSARSLG